MPSAITGIAGKHGRPVGGFGLDPEAKDHAGRRRPSADGQAAIAGPMRAASWPMIGEPMVSRIGSGSSARPACTGE